MENYKDYELKFEFLGRNIKTTIKARSPFEAKELMRGKIKFHSVEEKKEEPKTMFDDKTLKNFADRFNIKL